MLSQEHCQIAVGMYTDKLSQASALCSVTENLCSEALSSVCVLTPCFLPVEAAR